LLRQITSDECSNSPRHEARINSPADVFFAAVSASQLRSKMLKLILEI